jgi:hypothetical protein
LICINVAQGDIYCTGYCLNVNKDPPTPSNR